jgi:hypothetical protein
MSRNRKKTNRSRHACGQCREAKIVGFILAAFGIITICAFILPVKAWVFLLSLVLLASGILLFIL